MAKTNSGLVEYCKAQVTKPYWYGTFGQTGSQQLYKQKKAQYPKYYTATNYPSQYGQRVHDCVGLVKGYLWSDTPTSAPKYNASQDVGADTMYKKSTSKGAISSFPKVVGMCVYKGTASKKSHIGVYIGNNQVVEAKGHAYGVVVSSLDSWSYWGQCCWITNDITEAKPSEPIVTPSPAPSQPTGKKYKTTAVHGLNVRRGAGKNYGTVKCLKKGTVVTVYETKNGWGRIGTNQWCSMTYLKAV